VYLSAIQDLYNNEIIAYHISEQNNLSLVMKTLEKASKNRDMTGTLIHKDIHNRPDSTTRNFQQLGMVGSHSRKGNCLDHACMESFFSHLNWRYCVS
jgi:transposase InsO family protein